MLPEQPMPAAGRRTGEERELVSLCGHDLGQHKQSYCYVIVIVKSEE